MWVSIVESAGVLPAHGPPVRQILVIGHDVLLSLCYLSADATIGSCIVLVLLYNWDSPTLFCVLVFSNSSIGATLTLSFSSYDYFLGFYT